MRGHIHAASATTSPESEVAVAILTAVSLSISVVQSTSTCASGVEQASTLSPSVSALGKEVTVEVLSHLYGYMLWLTLPNTCRGKTHKPRMNEM